MTPPCHKILLVDDHQMFREGVARRLAQEADFQVVGEAANVADAMVAIERLQPDIVVLDIRMPGPSGIDLARDVRRQWPDLKMIVLSGYDFDQYVKALARIGIHGYLLKDSPQDDLVNALREVAAGGVVLPPKIARKVMKSYSEGGDAAKRAHLWDLTVRELDILDYLSQGNRNAEIGDKLNISSRTVETHVGSIIAKLGARSRTDAVRIAVEKGLLK